MTEAYKFFAEMTALCEHHDVDFWYEADADAEEAQEGHACFTGWFVFPVEEQKRAAIEREKAVVDHRQRQGG